MKFLNVAKQLIAWAHDPKDREPEIYQLVGKFLQTGGMGAMGGFLLASYIKESTVDGSISLNSDSLLLLNKTSKGHPRNLQTIGNLIKGKAFMFDQFDACREEDVTSRRFLYPFALTVCCRVNEAFGPHSYLIPESSISKIRNRVRTLFEPYSFHNPVVYNQLYPVSSFAFSNALNRTILSSVKYVSDSVFHGNVPPRPAPRFDRHYDEDKEEFIAGINRDYRMIYGVACLKMDLADNPIEFIRKVSNLNDLSEERCNAIIGDVSEYNSGGVTSTRRVDVSRLTINRPYPALDAYQHFIEGIHHQDIPTDNFWEDYQYI